MFSIKPSNILHDPPLDSPTSDQISPATAASEAQTPTWPESPCWGACGSYRSKTSRRAKLFLGSCDLWNLETQKRHAQNECSAEFQRFTVSSTFGCCVSREH